VALEFTLRSPSRAWPRHVVRVLGDPFEVSAESYRERFMKRVDRLVDLDPAGGRAANEANVRQLKLLGRELYLELFPPEMRRLYLDWRDRVRSILVTTSDVWLPWELIRPNESEGPGRFEDDFLGARFEIVRWLPDAPSPPTSLKAGKILHLEGEMSGRDHLPLAAQERDLLLGLARESGAEFEALGPADFERFEGVLRAGNLGLIHLIGHARRPEGRDSESSFDLGPDRPLYPGHLDGAALWAERPLVFSNACSTGQLGRVWTSVGGWAEAWIRKAGAGAFIAPQWRVTDSLAFEFARFFYTSLMNGRTIGESVRLARRWVRRRNPGDPTWLAYAAFADPTARMSFGP